ncbi:MAG: hypothetical protein EXS38_09565 [Opitutus sp.]|nr:hypothetical protein [Opitutus sp.]
MHGDFLRLLAQVKPSVVAWDFLFTEPSDKDQHFATGIMGMAPTPVVLGAVRADKGKGSTPDSKESKMSMLKLLPNVAGDRSLIPSDQEMLIPAGLLGQVAASDFVEGGTLDKYIGDAVVAMFGAPIALPDHAFRACVASQRVQVQLGELRVKWQSEGEKWPEIVWRMQSAHRLEQRPPASSATWASPEKWTQFRRL